MFIVFDTLNVYYIPQYMPVIQELTLRGHTVKLVCYSSKNDQEALAKTFDDVGVECLWVTDTQEAEQVYLTIKPDWIFFGNQFPHLDSVHQYSKTAQLGHGVGPKPSYYHKSITPMTVRFIEGSLRLAKIKQYYPNDNFVEVGFCKLDPLFKHQDLGLDLTALGLDTSKKTILYAPTFNPSSLECFPDDWPNDFKEYNILIKPHSLTQVRKQYANQRAKLAKWSTYPNVYVANENDISLLPFIQHADILLSEASSTLFEFAAVDRPVIVCNFFKLKWSYRGIFKYRFEQRFGKDNVLYSDIGLHVEKYKSLIKAIPEQLANPQAYQANRQQYTQEHVGPTDGLASVRIVDYIETYDKA